MGVLSIRCPECGEMLGCTVSGTYDNCQVTVDTQVCDCDVYGAWDDVWEEARERVFEQREFD